MNRDQIAAGDGLTHRGFVIAGHFNEPDTYSCVRAEGMKDWLITYTLGGEGYFEVPGQRLVCKENDITLLRPGTPHQYGTVKGGHWHFVWAHFDDKHLHTRVLPDKPLYNLTLQNESAKKRIYRAFMKILSDSREQYDYWNDLCLNSLNEILILLARRRERRLDSRIEEVLHRLSRDMHKPIKIEELAGSVHLSASRLSHLFKACTGQSIIDALNQMRIRQAALLLEHTDRSAAEISYDVGFQSYNHFINQFHKWLDMSPSDYRKTKRSAAL
ncbi:helix-turn-helix domain-containing protein [Paenibacillus nanensis]|uniref:Helix-turn-helix domain-containing protein n=1 Tax=Paenibacillus nanensis TaxID=393251 RepID=A0A3A1UVN8_9BACL|nr:helix-turn-helix domain-containing protein [Paenibacillus nanensis]RIX52344.1 helix-turn-helix domain-containing protein [Paenibacillus nanensis]